MKSETNSGRSGPRARGAARPGALLAPMLTASLAVACSGEDGTAIDPGAFPPPRADGASGSTERGSSRAEGAEPPLFAFVSQVLGAEAGNDQSYIVLTDSLDEPRQLDLSAAVEVPGRAIGAGPAGGGALFVGGDAGPTLTRYDLVEGPALQRGATLSFLGQGLARLGEYGGQFHFASDTKAYFFDGATASVVTFNPTEMTVRGAEPLEGLVIEGAQLTFSASPVVVGDSVVTFAGWRAGPAVPNVAGIVAVDTRTDDITVATDERCGYVRDGAVGSDGLVYVATEAYGAAVHRLNGESTNAPCLLRFDPESGEFDRDFHVELPTLFGGASAGSLIRGSRGAVFLRVLDESLFPITADTSPRLLASAGAWRWASLTLGDQPSVESADMDPSGGSIIVFDFDGAAYGALFRGRESTTFVAIGPSGLSSAGPTVDGLVFGAAKLR